MRSNNKKLIHLHNGTAVTAQIYLNIQLLNNTCADFLLLIEKKHAEFRTVES